MSDLFSPFRPFLGRKWSPDGKGPTHFNCYNLCRAVYRDVWGIDIPEVNVNARDVANVVRGFRNASDIPCWERIEQPLHGDAVVFAQRLAPVHMGLWLELNGGVILHAAERLGVTCVPAGMMRDYGYTKPEYYRWAG